MTGQVIPQVHSRQQRDEVCRMRAHDVLALREQQRKHAERLRAGAARFKARLNARLAHEARS